VWFPEIPTVVAAKHPTHQLFKLLSSAFTPLQRNTHISEWKKTKTQLGKGSREKKTYNFSCFPLKQTPHPIIFHLQKTFIYIRKYFPKLQKS